MRMRYERGSREKSINMQLSISHSLGIPSQQGSNAAYHGRICNWSFYHMRSPQNQWFLKTWAHREEKERLAVYPSSRPMKIAIWRRFLVRSFVLFEWWGRPGSPWRRCWRQSRLRIGWISRQTSRGACLTHPVGLHSGWWQCWWSESDVWFFPTLTLEAP